jgi:antitoxin VapB
MNTAKIFSNGRSQAVRLPKEFRFDVSEVGIKRLGSAVLLFPKDQAWDLMGEAVGCFSADFMKPRNQPRSSQKRKRL